MPSVHALATLITLLDPFSVGLVNPIIPQLLQADVLGASAWAVVMSTANLVACFAGTAYGQVSDKHGRRLAIIAALGTSLLGYGLYALGLALEGTSPLGRLVLPPLGRILGGIGRTGLNGPLLALLAERDPQRVQSVASSAATFGVGFSLGSLAGALLQQGAAVHDASGAWLNLLVLLACALVQFTCGLLLPYAPPTVATKRGRGAKEASLVEALRAGLREPATRVLIVLEGLFSASFHLYDSTSALYVLNHLGYTKAERGYILAWGAPATQGSNPKAGTTTTLLKATMAQVTGGSRLGLMLGVLASVEKGVGIAAPLIGGPVYDRVAPWAPACFASASAFIGLFVAAWLRLTPPAPACAPAATRAVQRRAVSPPRRRTPSPKRKRA